MDKVVTIQDISCFGKCSLTTALPVISAMGIETAVIPTAVLSTHTGGFKGYTFRDLTEDIPKIADHWKKLGLRFDAIYTGYLGSKEQIRIVSDFIGDFGKDGAAVVVDPVMGDAGRFYAGFTEDFVGEMRKLCAKADYIIPNMTEACFLLGIPYTDDYDEEFVKKILRGLAETGCRVPVLTGVHYDDKMQGAAAYDSGNGSYHFAMNTNIKRSIHGSGDIFASVFTGAVVLGDSLDGALGISVDFTLDCILATLPCIDEMWYGTCYELCLGELAEYAKKEREKNSG